MRLSPLAIGCAGIPRRTFNYYHYYYYCCRCVNRQKPCAYLCTGGNFHRRRPWCTRGRARCGCVNRWARVSGVIACSEDDASRIPLILTCRNSNFSNHKRTPLTRMRSDTFVAKRPFVDYATVWLRPDKKVCSIRTDVLKYRYRFTNNYFYFFLFSTDWLLKPFCTMQCFFSAHTTSSVVCYCICCTLRAHGTWA